MRVEFLMHEYVFAHGHLPRGTGTWAFWFDANREPWWAQGPCTYSEAKRQAQAEAERRRASRVYVAP